MRFLTSITYGYATRSSAVFVKKLRFVVRLPGLTEEIEFLLGMRFVVFRVTCGAIPKENEPHRASMQRKCYLVLYKGLRTPGPGTFQDSRSFSICSSLIGRLIPNPSPNTAFDFAEPFFGIKTTNEEGPFGPN